MFVHIVGPDGAITAQADRLDASPFGWRAGDIIAQVHRLQLSPDSASNAIELGLYNPDSGKRLSIVSNGIMIGDRLVLKTETAQ